MSAEKIVEHSWTPAFSCGADGVITAWNRGAEKLLATSGKTVVGRKCHEVMDGRDMFGNDYCCAGCASWRMTAANVAFINCHRIRMFESFSCTSSPPARA